MIYLFAILFILFASLTESMQLRERYINLSNEEKKKLNFWWHKTQWLERITAIITGYFLAPFELLSGFTLLLIVSGVFWIIYDGFINVALNRKFFHRSTTSTSFTDKFSYWWIKLPYLVITVIIHIYL